MVTKRTNWQDPLNQIEFKKAFKAKATEVTLRDGQKFTVEYEYREEYGNQVLYAWVKTVKQQHRDSRFAPSGWFNVNNYIKN